MATCRYNSSQEWFQSYRCSVPWLLVFNQKCLALLNSVTESHAQCCRSIIITWSPCQCFQLSEVVSFTKETGITGESSFQTWRSGQDYILVVLRVPMSHCGLLQFLNGEGTLFTGQSGGKGLGRRRDQGTASGWALEILCLAKRIIQPSPESLCFSKKPISYQTVL